MLMKEKQEGWTELCDECGAKAVNHKESKPLGELHGPNNTYWRKTDCERCKQITDCARYFIE